MNEKKKPEEWPKVMYGGHILGAELSKKTRDLRVMSILEAENEEQLSKQVFSMLPERDFQFSPRIDIYKFVEYLGWKR